MENKPLKIVYCTPALYLAGGMERVVTLKANYFADYYGYDVTIIITEGKGKPYFYPLSDKIKVVNLDINFEKLWNCGLLKRILIYLPKQYRYKRLLKRELMRIRPDITVSMLRREINFINEIKDGSKKIGEMHINRANFRKFEAEKHNFIKNLFARFWSGSLVSHLKKLDRFVVLTEKDREAWTELDNVEVIPNPSPFMPSQVSPLTEKRVIAVGRYSHEKGFDLLLRAWAEVEKQCADWYLDIYGDGDTTSYKELMDELGIDKRRCRLNGRTNDVEYEYCHSSLFVLSSRFEGFGMVIVEAMACGLPVVAFDCPWGPRAIIKEGEDGILAEKGNPSALAKGLICLMENDTKRVAMSIAAQRNVQRFSIDEIAQQWKCLFDEIVINTRQ
ncbi:glycosyltransferase family 4 protein [Prevotella sp. tf2-5]|uniref:glycosyltransferase family 4 protein n=1 Tax=Prevotella sp. tf2-5 TaxID=1761889 RepID=UPI0008ED0D09|nr:glycosyltransferase family 4 protein [Prevotella sp. tf2-5]SFO52764.1 Glycosyltransferase involved in cell wall bisynthesis [Prevotella sp. tf2-5]